MKHEQLVSSIKYQVSRQKKLVTCVLCLLSIWISNGQNVTIRGEAKNAEGKTITLYTYADQLSLTEKK